MNLLILFILICSSVVFLDAGAVHVGSHLYFIPQEDKLFGHGRVLRYDLRKQFKSASSWEASDIGELPRVKQAARGFHYATTWGPYIYFVPHYDISVSGLAVRYVSHQICTPLQDFTRTGAH